MYKISESYQVMCPLKPQLNVFNTNGLVNAPDHKVVYGEKYMGFTYPNDGRMRDQRGLLLVLDKPSQIGAVDMDDTFDMNNSRYGGVYESYNNINNGQITYYADSSVSQPFFNPVYTISSNVDKNIFIDPMDSHKPEYVKVPISTTLNNISNDQFTRDQLFFREDIMSKQQSLNNRKSWVNINEF